MTVRRTFLKVEELGERVTPSVSPWSILGHSPLAALFSQGKLIPVTAQSLHGSGTGTYTSAFQLPDTGTQFQLQGAGTFGSLGAVTISGNVHSVGFINNGHATGTLTLTNAKGSVTVELTGPAQDSFASLPQQFHFKVISGTGAYQNFHSQGTLKLQTNGTSATPGSPGAGTFSIQI